MILIATAPEGGEDVMHMEKPELKKITDDPNLPGLQKLVKLFFRAEQVESGGRRGFCSETRGTQEILSSVGPKGGNGSNRSFSWLGTLQRRAALQSSQNKPTMPRCERNL